ncbi:MAG: hypothetical protein V4727_09155 [Verrucomicrobiota bacterium]
MRYLTSIIITLSVLLNGCGNNEKQEIAIDVKIVGASEGDFKMIYDETQSLEYYLDGKFLGQNESGARKLLSSLEKIKGTCSVKMNVPPRIVAGTGKAVVSETTGLDPYLKNKAISHSIAKELNRILKR